MDRLYNQPTNTYLIILATIEILALIFSMLGGFSSGTFFILFRILFLIIAKCCKQPSSAAFYSVLALMGGLYAFDPVGLFVTGHGQKRTLSANIFCILACALNFVASYIGYHFKMALEREYGVNGGENSFSMPGMGGQQQQSAYSPSYFNNGNSVGYSGGNNRGQAYPNLDSNPYSGTGNFEPFKGEGYRLG